MPYSRKQWIKHIFINICSAWIGLLLYTRHCVWTLGIQKSKVLFQEAGSLPGERPVNHLLLCGVSTADVEESPGSWKIRMGIGLSWNSGERISEDSQKKMLAFSPRLKGLGSRHP